ncbi:hypothetical protein T492DRAFT_1064509 [Pavlovales sp. CCMP2436]|nr:hypothetical protein T492DRAFT_1064509 [Pavlovales sp. CCMP2436]|mmetsp:Transcript_14415/g.36591  ORF Transcript_14415/g.36591 Transcript_14415/m.36591 type:complete len:282 (+) Transcript_14415:38-883(+)
MRRTVELSTELAGMLAKTELTTGLASQPISMAAPARVGHGLSKASCPTHSDSESSSASYSKCSAAGVALPAIIRVVGQRALSACSSCPRASWVVRALPTNTGLSLLSCLRFGVGTCSRTLPPSGREGGAPVWPVRAQKSMSPARTLCSRCAQPSRSPARWPPSREAAAAAAAAAAARPSPRSKAPSSCAVAESSPPPNPSSRSPTSASDGRLASAAVEASSSTSPRCSLSARESWARRMLARAAASTTASEPSSRAASERASSSRLSRSSWWRKLILAACA